MTRAFGSGPPPRGAVAAAAVPRRLDRRDGVGEGEGDAGPPPLARLGDALRHLPATVAIRSTRRGPDAPAANVTRRGEATPPSLARARPRLNVSAAPPTRSHRRRP
jgi:hypothetical protein